MFFIDPIRKVACFLSFSLFLTAAAAPAPASAVDTVTATYVSAPLNVPSVIEKVQGRFARAYGKMGLKFAYSDLTSGADQTAALASGDIRILSAVGGTSVLLAASNGADIKIVSMYSRSPKAFMLFSNDPSIKSPKDLKGKTVAGPKGTVLHELLSAYLATAGMTVNDVDFLSMSIPNSLAALEGGSIDAALLAGPSAYDCMKGDKHLVTDGEGLISAGIVTAASQKFCDDHKEVIDTFLAEHEAVLGFMAENKDEALSMVAKELDLDLRAVEEMYGMYDFSSAVTEKDIQDLRKTEEFLYESGMIENRVDVKTLLLAR